MNANRHVVVLLLQNGYLTAADEKPNTPLPSGYL